jgi:hypothetical protein
MIIAAALTIATITAPGPGPGPALNDAIRYAQVAQWNAAASQSRTGNGTARPAHPPSPGGPPKPTTPSTLARIRQCESGGNYHAIDPTGTYRGAYQFDRRTWATVGGTGDPAAAPPAEQDARAQALYNQRGSAPWPICGQK